MENFEIGLGLQQIVGIAALDFAETEGKPLGKGFDLAYPLLFGVWVELVDPPA